MAKHPWLSKEGIVVAMEMAIEKQGKMSNNAGVNTHN